MKIAIINSKIDIAGCNIRRHLLKRLCTKDADGEGRGGKEGTDKGIDAGIEDTIAFGDHKLLFLEADERLIYENGLDERTDCDLIIFISRHYSQNPTPALTVHTTGNYGKAMLGGNDRELATAAPAMMHAVLNAMNRRLQAAAKENAAGKEGTDGKGQADMQADLGRYRLSYEVTHHGPTDLKTPSLFVEIGSTIDEWQDEEAGELVAGAVLDALSLDNDALNDVIRLIGLGGTHYAARQTEISLDSKGAFGHIAHTREIAGITVSSIEHMIEKTHADAVYIDRKALNAQELKRLESVIKESVYADIPVLPEGEIKEIKDISWENYVKIRESVSEKFPKLNFRIFALTDKESDSKKHAQKTPVISEIDPELVAEAYKTDPKGTVDGMEKMKLAALFSKNGILEPSFITYEEFGEQIINDLISLCVKILHKESGTAIEGDTLILKKVRFDPAKATELGVPKGPSFGKLAAGFEINLNGKTITPEMVSNQITKVIRIKGLEKYL
ncbi:MAG: D-tyrosyl-tRNA(Tyr) deacylase [Methanomicrobium sp.]|nr:D-tyrosyl-tRNA(Tyr) deacylase [Methanomicrobium sp.]